MGFSSALFAAAQPTPTPAAEPTTTESSSSLRSEDTHDDGHGNATTSPDKSAGAGKYNAYTYIYPWLGPDYTNGNISFETQFQDWEIENPAIALQEMLGEVWRKFVDGIHAEFSLPMFMSMSRFGHGISSTNTTTTTSSSSFSSSSSSSSPP
ncbi:hypothetical protein HRR87_006318, partial [Exophiala dermatitidis]